MKKLYDDLLREMPVGWQNAFGMELCMEIEAAIERSGLAGSAEVLQVKEKFGELRIYICPTSDEIEKTVEKYTGLSRRTCIGCGAPATRVTTGWISPWCDECLAKQGSKHSEPIALFWKE